MLLRSCLLIKGKNVTTFRFSNFPNWWPIANFSSKYWNFSSRRLNHSSWHFLSVRLSTRVYTKRRLYGHSEGAVKRWNHFSKILRNFEAVETQMKLHCVSQVRWKLCKYQHLRKNMCDASTKMLLPLHPSKDRKTNKSECPRANWVFRLLF